MSPIPDPSLPRQKRVMMIDDSQVISAQARTMLTDAGYDVETADDGFAALARMSSYEPDVIFIDIVMPRLDGYETVALLRTNPRFARTPIIMMSSKGGAFDIGKGKLVGCDDYVIKPFEREQLLACVGKHAGPPTGA